MVKLKREGEKLRMRFVDPLTVIAGDLISDGVILCRVEFINKRASAKVVNISACDVNAEPQYLAWPKGKPILKCTDRRIIQP